MSSAAEQAKASQAASQTVEPGGLLEKILDEGPSLMKMKEEEEKKRARTYLEEFIKQTIQPGQIVSKNVESTIKTWIAQIDQKLSAQLNEIMHHPEFQRLEGTWRGLFYLVDKSETGEKMQIRILNVKKRELFKDLENAIEFDQSSLFKKVYEAEYGMFGGHPYGLLVGDYEFCHEPEDISLLELVSKVAACAHAPFVAGADPKILNMDRFTELPQPRDLAMIFRSVEHTKWNAFRDSEDSRYAALVLPHVLGRLPYGQKFKKVDAFNFEEAVDGKDHDKYLWMNASWAYAARVTDAFAKDGWFARTRGAGPEAGGRVEGLPIHTFKTDKGDVVMKSPTEVDITERRELELSNLGFLPLAHYKGKDYAAFIGAQSCQKPKKYFDPAANANAELSTKFNYLLCVSRFAHYLKVMARDRIGEFMEATECEKWLNEWIQNYVHPMPETAGPKAKAEKPLAAAKVLVKENKASPGHYIAQAWLRPHFQLEKLDTDLSLVAELPPQARK